MKWLLALPLLLPISFAANPVHAQYGREPQAESAEEYDQYLECSAAQTPQDVLRAASAFTTKWPGSALLPLVYEQELEAYESVGDPANAVKAGEAVVSRMPDNLRVMAELAYLLADSSQEVAQLKRAQDYGQRVLELLPAFQIPRSISPGEWKEIRLSLEKKAREALGLVAFKESRLGDAATEFELALKADRYHDLSLLYRLGVVDRLIGRIDQARQNLTRAAESTDPLIHQRALDELEEMQRAR